MGQQGVVCSFVEWAFGGRVSDDETGKHAIPDDAAQVGRSISFFGVSPWAYLELAS
jgi:hypothetical protein